MNTPLRGLWAVAAAALMWPQGARAEQGVRAFVTNWGGDSIAVVDPVKGKLVADVETGAKPHGVAVAPDGKLAVVSNTGSGDVSIVDVARRKTISTVKVGKAPKRVTVGAVVVAP